MVETPPLLLPHTFFAFVQKSAAFPSHHPVHGVHEHARSQNSCTDLQGLFSVPVAEIFLPVLMYLLHSAQKYACDSPPTASKNCSQNHILSHQNILSDEIKNAASVASVSFPCAAISFVMPVSETTFSDSFRFGLMISEKQPSRHFRAPLQLQPPECGLSLRSALSFPGRSPHNQLT